MTAKHGSDPRSRVADRATAGPRSRPRGRPPCQLHLARPGCCGQAKPAQPVTAAGAGCRRLDKVDSRPCCRLGTNPWACGRLRMYAYIRTVNGAREPRRARREARGADSRLCDAQGAGPRGWGGALASARRGALALTLGKRRLLDSLPRFLSHGQCPPKGNPRHGCTITPHNTKFHRGCVLFPYRGPTTPS